MADLSTALYWGSSEIPQLPMLGELYPQALNVLEVCIASGTTDGVPTATSDSDADFMVDTQDNDFQIINIEGGSDSDNGRGVYVLNVLPVVVTLFTASVTATLGDTDDAGGWGADAGFDVSVSCTGALIGGSDDVDDDNWPYNNQGGKFYPTSSGQVEFAFAGTTNIAAGRLHVYALYFQTRLPSGF